MLISKIYKYINQLKAYLKASKEERAKMTAEKKAAAKAKRVEFKPIELHNTNSWIEQKYVTEYNKDLGKFGKFTEKMIPNPKTDDDYAYNMGLISKYRVCRTISVGIIIALTLVVFFFALYIVLILAFYLIYILALIFGWCTNHIGVLHQLLGDIPWEFSEFLRRLLPWGWFW